MAYTLKRVFAVGTPTFINNNTQLSTKFNIVVGIEGDTKDICNYEDTGMDEVITLVSVNPIGIYEAAQEAATDYLLANYNS